MLVEMGFQLFATKSTCEFLRGVPDGPPCELVHKPSVQRQPNVAGMLQNGKLDLVINVPDSMDSEGLTDGFEVRRAAVDSNTPLLTDIKCAILCIQALHRKWSRERAGKEFWSYDSWQEHVL